MIRHEGEVLKEKRNYELKITENNIKKTEIEKLKKENKLKTSSVCTPFTVILFFLGDRQFYIKTNQVKRRF